MQFHTPTANDVARRSAVRRSRAAMRLAPWVALVAGCYLLAEAGERLGVPAAQLICSLAVGAALALSGLVRRPFPKPAWSAAQALIGVLMGSYLSGQALAAVAPRALALSAATLLTIAICTAIALALARMSRVSTTEAVLAMAPGGSAAIISTAAEHGADSRTVAAAQYLRVALVALAAPLVVTAVGGGAEGVPAADLGSPRASGILTASPGLWPVVVLAAVCVVGAIAGRWMKLPSALLLGPLLVSMLLTLTGVAHGFAPAGPLRDVALVIVGLEVGLRFTRATISHLGRLLPELLLCISGVCVLCAGIAWGLGRVIGIPFVDAYLATTPGGINAVLATTATTSTDVPLVSTVQSLRLVIVILTVPLLLRWLTHRGSNHAPSAGA
ncbi:AbrB family transcriptional regulator [Rhodococcus sp. ACT016]|uniref:AbrB family transcriptional regulator n=1 Tax=Rhodococcus sp. ACT016 TaxID=3134808 RepID=UPI003D2C1E0A